jgi:N-methylhydantoinase A
LPGDTVIGIDTGGTFTDLVAWIDGALVVRKVLSSPADPGEAVLEALGDYAEGRSPIVHGTTVATNALLERRGARVALVTTSGFEDVIEIARQSRPDPYALEPRRPEPLVPRGRRFGVGGPLDPVEAGRGRPAEEKLARLRTRLESAQVEAVAVCLLFSYLDRAAEDLIAAALEGGPWEVSLSSRVLPTFREYERTSTTVANAYVAPVMSRYLRGLERRARRPEWRVMASNAGSLDLDAAARLPAACLLSGPAGGVLGAARIAESLGIDNFMTLDMGGTSTDVCLVERAVPTSDQATVAGLPVAFPAVDIHTVGAGGGSIVRLDRAGVLRVGPESSGADPGPIAYGRGERPTVTDANLLLGRIPSDTFQHLGEFESGERQPASVIERVRAAFAELAARLGVGAAETAAAACASVEASMARALRVISTRRGRDPRGSTLMCFGGAGPLHGAALAGALGIERVVVPPSPGALSAFGLATADARRDYVRAVMRPVDATLDHATLAGLAEPLVEEARSEAGAARAAELELAASLDLRYRGQSHEIEVPLADDFAERFHIEHESRFGHADRHRPLDLVHVRVRAILPGARFELAALELASGEKVQSPAGPSGAKVAGRLRARITLARGEAIEGPAVVIEPTSTTWLPHGWRGEVASGGSLVLTRLRSWGGS